MQDNHQHAELEATISNPQGLHARPVMRFVDLAAQFSSAIRVRKGSTSVDGKSPMEMMLLEAGKGTALWVIADGPDARQAVEALAALINDGFGES